MKLNTINISKLTLTKNIFGGLIITTILSGCEDKSQTTDTSSKYEVGILSYDQRTLSTQYSASIQGKQDIAIYPQVGGTITQVEVGEGAVVKKGEVLFIIDQTPYIAALNTAKANVAAVTAQLATAQLNFDSRKELYSQKVVSEYDFRTSENSLALAKAELEQAKAGLLNAENNYSYTIIKSPSDGVVGTLPFKIGSLVSPSMSIPLTTVSDNNKMYVYFSVNENQLLSFVRRYGSIEKAIDSLPNVQLMLSDGSMYEQQGKIENISGVIDRSTGSVILKAVFPNNDRLLYSGSTGNILIPIQYTDCIVIPQASTYEMQDKRFVYKIIDGKATATQISVSPISNSNELIVTQGLNINDTIALSGISTLKDGMQIQ